MSHCSARGADTRVYSADTLVGAAVQDLLHFIHLVSSVIETAKPEKFVA